MKFVFYLISGFVFLGCCHDRDENNVTPALSSLLDGKHENHHCFALEQHQSDIQEVASVKKVRWVQRVRYRMVREAVR